MLCVNALGLIRGNEQQSYKRLRGMHEREYSFLRSSTTFFCIEQHIALLTIGFTTLITPSTQLYAHFIYERHATLDGP